MRPLVQRLNIARGTASEEAGAQAACGDHNTYEDNVSWPPQMQETVWQENVEDALQAAYPHDPWDTHRGAFTTYCNRRRHLAAFVRRRP